MILCIDTAIEKCSVSLTWEGKTIDKIEHDDAFKASEVLHSLIKKLLDVNEKLASDIRAIAINGGPGSYTGLRIGAASAKGLCYALNIPLIHIDGLILMTYGIINRYHQTGFDYYIPMIDARRMEVYTCILNDKYENFLEPQPVILSEVFATDLSENKILIFGNGSLKASEIIKHPNAKFYTHFESNIIDFNELVWQKYINSDFENTTYYSPKYLKGLYVKS